MRGPHRVIARALASGALAATALAVTAMTATAAAPAGARAATAPGAGLPRLPGTAKLAGSVAPFAGTSRPAGTAPGGGRLTIQVWLKPRTAAAESFASAVSTPGSKQFRRYLSPAAYTARFGPTRAAATAVTNWLRSAGFSGVAADAGRDYVQATAPVATIESALGTRLRYYRPTVRAAAGRYQLRANDRPLTLPASLAGSVLGITGLDNAAPRTTYARAGNPAARADAAISPSASLSCSQWYLQHYARGLPAHFGTTSMPTEVCGYSADQLRRAYGYNRHNIGKGVTVALVEVGLAPDMFQTLRRYAAANHIQSPAPGRYAELSLGRGAACGDPFNIEEQMDVEASYVMAPLASQLVVGGDSCDNGDFGLQSLFDADTAILNGAHGRPLAEVVSNSWESGDEAIPANEIAIEHAYLVRAAAEGVTMLFAAGDSYPGGPAGVETPSSDPYATAVGGTTLGIGRLVPRLFETGWSTGVSGDTSGRWVFEGEQGATGGGPSVLWKQPAYQRRAVPAALARAPGDRGGLVRAVPDISADADPFTGMAVGLLDYDDSGQVSGYYQTSMGGTSLATPLVAGIIADAEQYQRWFGFLNPALYKLAGTSAFHDALQVTAGTPSRYHGVVCDAATCGELTLATFDDQSRSMPGYAGQVTRTGYDTMTGLGSPGGQHFIYDLRDL